MKKTILATSLVALISITSSFSAMAVNLQQDTFPYIACSVIEKALATKGKEGNIKLSSYYNSGALLNEYMDRGHSLDKISKILSKVEQGYPSREKKYHQGIISDIKETTDFFTNLMKKEGVTSVKAWKKQRDSEWMCRTKVKPNLMEMNSIFHFMN